MTFKYILPDTPDLILTTAGIDVFEATIGSLTYSDSSVVDDLVEAAWERFGQRPIGDYDYEHWLTTFADAVKYNWRWYVKSLPMILATPIITELSDSSSTTSESETVNTVNIGSETVAVIGDVDTTVRNTGTVGVSGTFTNTNSGSVVQAQETMPDTASPSNYLAGRVTTTDTTALGNTHTDTTTNNLTTTDAQTSSNDTDRDSRNDIDVTRVRNSSIINTAKPKIQLTIEIVKQLEELNDLYLSRLDKYFMNRW